MAYKIVNSAASMSICLEFANVIDEAGSPLSRPAGRDTESASITNSGEEEESS
ncbi:hypothetical protein ABID58_007479 [Bradyrhizobium sp. S3.2.6]